MHVAKCQVTQTQLVYKLNLLPKSFLIDSRDKDRPCSWPTLMSAQQFWQPHSSHILPLFLSASSCTAQRSGAFALSYASSAGSAGILWRTREARISHHSSKSDVNPLRRNPKKLFKHFLILVHFVKMIDKDDLNFCWWDVGRPNCVSKTPGTATVNVTCVINIKHI